MKKNKNKKGFTLIELLAVIIILGILMIIAIPAVTSFISDSRKDAYVDTAKQVVKGAMNLVNSGELQMRDINATYYMPSSCVRVENGEVAKSPYGEFDPAYIVINYNGSGNGYDYYWMSRDDTGIGVKTPISIDDLDTDDIESDITEQDFIDNITTIDKRTKFLFFNEDCTSKDDRKPTSYGKLLPVNECTFDGLMSVGAEYTNGQYTYRFRQQINNINNGNYVWESIDKEGWSVRLTDKNSTSPVNTKICTSINGKPIVSMRYMFYDTNAESIDVSSFDTSNVTDMSFMFMNASEITELDLSRFDTAELTFFTYFASYCPKLENVNMDNWNFLKTSGSTSGGSSFYGDTSIKTMSARNWKIPQNFTHVFSRTWAGMNNPVEEIDVTGWDLSKAKDISGIFGDCKNLKTIVGTDTWNTSKVTSISNMFGGCSSLEEVNMDNWDLSKIGNAAGGGGMFSGATVLKRISAKNWVLPQTFNDVFSRTWSGSGLPIEEIDVTGWDLSKTKELQGLFADSRSLKNIIGIDSWNTSNLVNISNMFGSCASLKSLDLSTFDTSKLQMFQSLFYNCTSLESVNMDNWNLSKISNTDAGGGSLSNTIALKTISARNWKIPQNFNDVFSRTWFGGGSPIETIDVTGWDLSNTVNISGLFGNSSHLKNIIGLDTWDTSNIQNLNNLFVYCSNIKTIDLSNFDTSNLLNYQSMFASCSSLESVNMDNWDLSKTGNSSAGGGLTSGATKLKKISAKNWKLPQTFTHVFSRTWGMGSPVEEIDVTGWDLSNTTDIQGLFGDANNLKKITGMNTWDTSKITSFSNLFYNCYSLTDFDVSHFDTRNVTDMTVMFNNCQSIKNLNLSNFNTSKVTNHPAMFYGCTNLETLNLDNWDLTKTGSSGSGGSLTSGATKLKKISAKNWKLPQTFTHVFSRTWGMGSPVEEIDVTGWDLSNTTDIQGLFGDANNLKKITGMNTWDTSKITSFSNLFYNCYSLTDFDVSHFDTRNVTDMTVMFNNCQSIKNLNLSNFNTSKVTNHPAMFYGCTNLETLNLDNWDVSKTNGSGAGGSMLYGTTKLKTLSVKNWKLPQAYTYVFSITWGGSSSPIETIDVTGWNLSNTTDIQGLFGDSYNLKTIVGLNTWDTSKITNFNHLFYNCRNLTNFDVSRFNTTNVTDMNSMFQNCSSINNIDLSSFNTSNVTNMQSMFNNCSNITTLDLSSFSVSQISDNYVSGMIYGCSSLTTGYAKTQADADKLNSSAASKPNGMSFIVK